MNRDRICDAQTSALAGKAAPRVPLCDLARQAAELDAEITAAVQRVCRSGHYILGPECERFEQSMAELSGASFAVGCASGSDALLLALMALDIGPGDEVIVPSYTFFATAGSVCHAGAKPVFVDVEPRALTIDPELVAARITPRTKAIVPVHLFGHCADVEALSRMARSSGVAIVEDAAQAIGATWDHLPVGSWGDLGCFSFFPTKNLGAHGDGGLVATSRADLAEKLQMLRVHGRRSRHQHELVGINSRLDTLQAAILQVKLGHLARWTLKRRELAEQYGRLFAAQGLEQSLATPETDERCQPVWSQYVVRVLEGRRDALAASLAAAGIGTEVYYALPLHLQPCFESLGYARGSLPVSERAAGEALALPMFPELTNDEQDFVVEQIAAFFGG